MTTTAAFDDKNCESMTDARISDCSTTQCSTLISNYYTIYTAISAVVSCSVAAAAVHLAAAQQF